MVSVHIDLLQSWTPQWLSSVPSILMPVVVLAGLLIAVVSAMVLFVVGQTTYRHISLLLGTDIYAQFPRAQHTSKRWWWLLGDVPEIRQAAPAAAHIKWQRELGTPTYVYRGLFYVPRLILSDVKSLNYIFGQGQSYAYPKPTTAREFLSTMLGDGLLVAEGDVHKRQRRIIQPAFNVSAMRDLTPVFFRHANAFVARLGELVDETKGPADQPFIEGQSEQCAKRSEPLKPALDVSHWFNRVTLDIIGEAGFGHSFNAVSLPLAEHTDTIIKAFSTLMRTMTNIKISDIILFSVSRLPKLAWVAKAPTERRRNVQGAKASLDATGRSIIERKRAEIKRELQETISATSAQAGEKAFFAEQGKSKDLLYLMMKANLAPDVRESERMSDAELLGQITTLLAAGHETTSTLLTWFVHTITQKGNEHVAPKLRAEIEEHFAGRDELDYDALMAMPYLDNCTKEILRYVSPVVMTEREVTQDDMVPVSKPIKLLNGKTIDAVPVTKGQQLFIVVHALNRSKDLWGETADEFDPDRWSNVPRAAKESGLPLHILSFLEGPRGCIGQRFALSEFKAILCILLRSFKFESLGWEVEPKQGIVVRPRIVGQEKLGSQMPVWLSRV